MSMARKEQTKAVGAGCFLTKKDIEGAGYFRYYDKSQKKDDSDWSRLLKSILRLNNLN